MATTSGTLATGNTAVAGRGGNGKRGKGRVAGLVATAALGLGLLGGSIAQGWPAAPAAQPSASPFAGDTHVQSVWDFREDRRAETRDRFLPDQFTYREDRRAESVPVLVPSDHVPDFWTYREDRRVELVPVPATDTFFPDQFTYREDRRGDGAPALTPPGPANFQGEDH